MKKFSLFIFLCFFLVSNSYAGWFDKNKIKVTKCYDISVFKNYKAHLKDLERKKESGFPFILTKWEWELNLKEKIAYRTTIMNGELGINQFRIKIATDDYIIVHDPTGDVQFDLRNEGVVVSSLDTNSSTMHQCKFK
tara:strand:- start:52 stop:462 length:411 start_codon:yes stop_codon:yes gene_type:complete